MRLDFWRRRSLEEMLEALARCGVALRPDIPVEALFRPESRWKSGCSGESLEKGGFEALLIRMGEEGDGSAAPPSDDIWHFDVECINDHGDYRRIAEQLSRLSRGDLVFEGIADHVDVVAGIAWVELARAGRTERVDLRVDDDWVDERIFAHIQHLLMASGSARRFAMHSLGQDCLIACQPEAGIKALNRTTGLRFVPL